RRSRRRGIPVRRRSTKASRWRTFCRPRRSHSDRNSRGRSWRTASWSRQPTGIVSSSHSPEIVPELTAKAWLLPDRKEGKALDAKEGPYRLIVPQDKRAMRWVRQVNRIAVQRGPDAKENAEPRTQRAVDELRKLGAKIEVDEKAPGKPVVKIALGGTATTDAGLAHLSALPHLE